MCKQVEVTPAQMPLLLKYAIMHAHVHQIGIFALHVEKSPVHISCQLQLQPHNSCKMSIPAMQNYFSKAILCATLYSQLLKIFIQAICRHAMSRPQHRSALH